MYHFQYLQSFFYFVDALRSHSIKITKITWTSDVELSMSLTRAENSYFESFYFEPFVSSYDPPSSPRTRAIALETGLGVVFFSRISLCVHRLSGPLIYPAQRILLSLLATTMSITPLIWRKVWLSIWLRRNTPSILLSIALSVTTMFSYIFAVIMSRMSSLFNMVVLKRRHGLLVLTSFADIDDTIEFALSDSPLTRNLRLEIVALIHFPAQVDVTVDFLQVDVIHPKIGLRHAKTLHHLSRFTRTDF